MMINRNKFLTVLCSILAARHCVPSVSAVPGVGDRKIAEKNVNLGIAPGLKLGENSNGSFDADTTSRRGSSKGKKGVSFGIVSGVGLKENSKLPSNDGNSKEKFVKSKNVDYDSAYHDLMCKYERDSKLSGDLNNLSRMFTGRMTDSGKKRVRGEAVVSVFGRMNTWVSDEISMSGAEVDRILNALRDLARFHKMPNVCGVYLKIINSAISRLEKLVGKNLGKYHPNRIWISYVLAVLFASLGVCGVTLHVKGKIGEKFVDLLATSNVTCFVLSVATVVVGNELVSLPAHDAAACEGLVKFLKECLEVAKVAEIWGRDKCDDYICDFGD